MWCRAADDVALPSARTMLPVPLLRRQRIPSDRRGAQSETQMYQMGFFVSQKPPLTTPRGTATLRRTTGVAEWKLCPPPPCLLHVSAALLQERCITCFPSYICLHYRRSSKWMKSVTYKPALITTNSCTCYVCICRRFCWLKLVSSNHRVRFPRVHEHRGSTICEWPRWLSEMRPCTSDSTSTQTCH